MSENRVAGADLPGLGALAARLRAYRGPLALFLDFDGTLARICDRPADARPEPAAVRALAALSAAIPVAIVSGRALGDLRGLIDLPRATYFGSHGQEAKMPGGPIVHPFGKSEAALEPVLARIGRLAERFPGAWIEEKPQAVVLHYRNLRDEALQAQLRGRIEELAGELAGLRMMAGRKIFEFVPAAAPGKGGALNWQLGRLGARSGANFLPVYFGDDVTDEDAFAAVAAAGFGVLVAARSRPSAAGYRLNGVNEVAAALTLLARQRSS